MQEVLSGEAPEPTQGQEAAVLPRLRLTPPSRVLLAASSGLLLFLANRPAFLWPLAFVALIPLLIALSGVGSGSGALLGAVTGFVSFGLILYWILLFGELAWGGLTLLQTGFLALFGALAPPLMRGRGSWLVALGVSSLWVAIEFLRTAFPLGGFGWGALSYTQVDDRALLRLATVTGAWGISFVVVFVNVLLWKAFQAREWGRGARLAGVAAVMVLAPVLIPVADPEGRFIDVAAVQITVPKDLALTPELEVREVAERHFELHRTLAADPPELAVWAEDSLYPDPTLDAELGEGLRSALADVGVPTLTGAIMGPADGRRYNQGVLYAPDAAILGRHSKTHLVPFGEYVPWRDRLDFLELLEQVQRDLTPGRALSPLFLDGLAFGDVICFENVFPEVARTLTDEGAGFLTVTTNNASSLTTAAPAQHLDISRMRAVENARWVVHSAISGSSAFIDPQGGMHDRTDLFEPTIIRRSVQASSALTPYTLTGDWFAWASVLAAGILLVMPRTRRTNIRKPGPLPASPRTLIMLPTYNEAQTIGQVMDRLLALDGDLHLLVIDDGSPDGTGDLVQTRSTTEPRVSLLRRPKKSGLASAYLDGFARAVAEGYDLAVEMDSDLSHDPEELPSLLQAAGDHHMVIGSRYVPGGSVTNWGFLRRLLSKAGNRYAQLCLGFPIKDSTSGYRVYRRELIEAEILDKGIHSEGYGFQVELAFRSWRDGWDVGESPITFREREHGHSKISRTIVIEALWEVTVWGLRERFGKPRPSQS